MKNIFSCFTRPRLDTQNKLADTTSKKGLNGQNHSSSDSHHHITIPLPAKYLDTEKTSIKHDATKNHSGQSELPEQR